jgi:3-hydroxybutyryl-CoA dehydratase
VGGVALPAAFSYRAFRVTPEMVRAYAELTLDRNPIHLDEAFAARTPFGKPIAHGTLSLNAIWQALRAHAIDAANADVSIKFVAPVFVGDELTAQFKLSARGSYDVSIITHDARVVVEAMVKINAAG